MNYKLIKILLSLNLIVLTFTACEKKCPTDELGNAISKYMEKIELKSNFKMRNDNCKDLELDFDILPPYKLIHPDFQKMMLIKLINDLKISDDYLKIKCNTFIKIKSEEIKHNFNFNNNEEELSSRVNEIYEYCLLNFEDLDFYRFDEALTASYNSMPEQTYNVDFFESIKLFDKECENDLEVKIRLNYLLIYIFYEDSEDLSLKNISSHMKNIWKIGTKKDIEVAKKALFKNLGYE